MKCKTAGWGVRIPIPSWGLTEDPYAEAGAAETCVREVVEETGLEVEVTRLVGIYTSPDMIIEYSDGSKIQPVTFSFEVEIIGGELGLSNETIDFGWYTVAEIEAMDTLEHHLTRIHDSVKNLPEAAFR